MNPAAILKRVLSGAAAAGAIFACAAVFVVAASYALYALAKEWVGAPGAAAVVALVFALIAGVAAFVAFSGAKGPKITASSAKPLKGKRGEPLAEESPLDKIIDLARERPLIAAGAAVAAGLMALRNPLIVTTLISTLTKPRRPRA